jgi:hypothetical protein
VQLGSKLGRRFQLLGTAPSQLRPLTRRIGFGIVTADRVATGLRAAYPDNFTGDFRGADAVVYYRTNDPRDTQSKNFESALIEGLRQPGLPAVGVERSSTDPSQIPFYVNAGLSTVDAIDIPPGRIALVLTLTGRKGNFGFKKTAEAPLPPAPPGLGG